MQSPVFYKNGWHWSHAWGETAAANFLEYMNTYSRYDLSLVDVREVPSNEPIEPDIDLYSSLNLLMKPSEQWYSTEVTIKSEGADHPSVFLRGCSFMGQSLNALINSGVFDKDVHFENYYYTTNRYATLDMLSSFTAYDEMDLDTLVGQSDILILEVNEGTIHTMSWEFIEYLLEHPEYLDRTY